MPWAGWVQPPMWVYEAISTWFVIGAVYTIALQLTMAALAVGGNLHLRDHHGALRPGQLHHLTATNRPPGVSIVVPAHNEGPVIVPTVRALLASDYRDLEIVVVDDGSTDGTLAHLVEAFHLAPVAPPPPGLAGLTTATVRGHYLPLGDVRLRVISKDAGGCKADAVNAGINAATRPLLLVVDGDGLLDRRAISLAVAAFTEGGRDVVAAGGTILPINDCVVEGTTVSDARVPRSFLAACQLLEYLRAFVIGRTGLARAGAVTLVSGAFGLFRTGTVRAVGGYTVGHLGEDLDITLRLLRHHRLAHPGSSPRVVQVPEAILWTEVPATWSVLARQRVRWHRGLVQALQEHSDLVGRPRWGAIGMVGMPQLVLFELFAPLIQGVGMLTMVLVVGLGVFDPVLGAALIATVMTAGLVATVTAIWAEERNLRQYLSTRDLLRLLAVAVAEQVVYLPVTVLWRLKATFMRGPAVWGEMTRSGFGPATAPAPAPATATP